MDERFGVHRLKATRLACIAGSVALGGIYLYGFFGQGNSRYELLGVLILMGLVKGAAMLYYRRAN